VETFKQNKGKKTKEKKNPIQENRYKG